MESFREEQYTDMGLFLTGAAWYYLCPTHTFILSNLCDFFLVQTCNLTDPLFTNSAFEPLSEIHVAFPVFQSYKIETVLNESP